MSPVGCPAWFNVCTSKSRQQTSSSMFLKRPTENGIGCAVLWLINSRYFSITVLFSWVFLITAFRVATWSVMRLKFTHSPLYFLQVKDGLWNDSEIAKVGLCWRLTSCTDRLAEFRQKNIYISLHVSSWQRASDLIYEDSFCMWKWH